jgi:CRP-like cAMP-binding protein
LKDKNNPTAIELPLQKLRKMFSQYVQIPEKEWQAVKPFVQLVKIKKGDYFIKEGQVCRQLGFLNEGLLRVYYTADGKEITSYFNSGHRNPIVSAFYSFLSTQPSLENIHALEDSELIVIDYENLEELYEQNPLFQKLGRLMAEQNYLASVLRIYSLQNKPALERYEDLLRKYKHVIQHIPQHYIASYLGITPESLSRIRSGIAKK